MDVSALADREILVVGDVILDHFVFGQAERVSPEAPALVVHVQDERWMLGGAGNVAANIASLGGRAILVGVAGRDDAADRLGQLITLHHGRLTSALVVSPELPTIQKTRYLAGDRHLLRADRERIGVPAEAEAEVIRRVREDLPRCDGVVVSDYLKGVVTEAVLDVVRETAAVRAIPVVIDPKRRDLGAYRGATVLTPNRRELANATGLDVLEDAAAATAAEQVMAQTGAAILLTQSEKGVTLFRPGARPWRDPAHAQRVRDISGAGDTVAATLGLALAAGLELETASHMANVAAAVAVGKSGVSLVTPEELQLAILSVHPEQELTGRPLDLDLALKVRKVWRDEGLRVGFTNGCFDLLHPGHVKLLEEARAACDRLIVALNTDASVRRLKGAARPVQSEDARAAVIGAVRPVDLVVLFDDDTPLSLIDALQPDVLVKGADYREDQVVGADLVRARGGEVRLVQLAPDQSTSGLIERSSAGRTAA